MVILEKDYVARKETQTNVISDLENMTMDWAPFPQIFIKQVGCHCCIIWF